jgi:hypothetical protein
VTSVSMKIAAMDRSDQPAAPRVPPWPGITVAGTSEGGAVLARAKELVVFARKQRELPARGVD